MTAAINLTGARFGRWTVIGKAPDWSVKRPAWHCRCDCGTERAVLRNHLRSGHSQSCGCLKAEASSMANSATLTGKTFGRLTVIERCGSQRTRDKRASSALWRCLCSCGNETTATSWKLTSGYKKSCGCAFTDAITTHGKSRSRAYRIWQHMKARCSDRATGETRANYYARGIRVCERWLDFANFYADMGDPPAGWSIERRDPNDNYTPENCEWASRPEQNRNTRRTKVVTVDGRKMLLTDAIAMLRAQARNLHARG